MKDKTTQAAILPLYKPAGITSFSFLYKVKRLFGKKVGHCGTLDKFAEGLMLVVTGPFTRLAQLFEGLDKTYRAQLQFGYETDTLDPEGSQVAEAPVPDYSIIESVLPKFIGTQSQRPPTYSAVHIDGKRAYRMARSGQEVIMPERTITVYDIAVVSWNNPVLTIDVRVSKGTYIRSLARDIGLACASRASLISLVRTEVGPFSLQDTMELESGTLISHATEKTPNLLQRLSAVGTYICTEEEVAPFLNGKLPKATLETMYRHAMLFSPKGVFLGVSELDESGTMKKITVILREQNHDS